MKAVVAAFNQEKALVGAFSVITNLRTELFLALVESLLWNVHLFRHYFCTDVIDVVTMFRVEQKGSNLQHQAWGSKYNQASTNISKLSSILKYILISIMLK